MRLVNGAAMRTDARLGVTREGVLLTLVLVTLVRSGEALAGDAGNEFNPPAASMLADPAFTARELAATAPVPVHPFSLTEFRPRPQAALESEADRGGLGMDEHLIGSSTVWQHLEQFRSEDRVRLLTLWQTRASTVSLQADKHGGPSLQWSSPWMLRGRSSNGLLDRLFNVPARGIASRIGAQKGAAKGPAPLSSLKPAEATAANKSNSPAR
ncbi:MAG TPA: hypothetical protein VGI65_04260 [Steroidobacteraceae bacterium]